MNMKGGSPPWRIVDGEGRTFGSAASRDEAYQWAEVVHWEAEQGAYGRSGGPEGGLFIVPPSGKRWERAYE